MTWKTQSLPKIMAVFRTKSQRINALVEKKLALKQLITFYFAEITSKVKRALMIEMKSVL